MKILLLFVFILFSKSILAQKIEIKEILAREKSLLSTRNIDSLAVKYFDLFGDFYYLDREKSNFYLNHYFNLAKAHSDSLKMGLYYHEVCKRELYEGNYLASYNTAVESAIFTKNRDNFHYLETIQIQMMALNFLGENIKAEVIGKELIKESEFADHPVQLAKIYFNLGIAAKGLLKDSSAVYFYKAIPYLVENPVNNVLLHLYHNLSEFYHERNQLDSALKYASLSVGLANQTGYDEMDYLLPAYNYQKLLYRTGRMKEAADMAGNIRMNRYKGKVKFIEYPQRFSRSLYLEYLSNKQKNRFIILASFFIMVLIILFFIGFYNWKLKKKGQELAESLNLNKVLLLETNHRVKNNYQMMLSMLRLNADVEQSTQQFIKQTEARISSMSKVHDLFLQSSKSPIDADLFFREIIESLDESLGLSNKNITVHFDTNDYEFERDLIITLGLIVNELVVNSLKYAFSERNSGEIRISLEKKDECFAMIYKDNGKGIGPNSVHTKGTGMSIISSMAKQLKGEVKILKDQGTHVEIWFKDCKIGRL
jgi:two-component sensor histidine kinase